MTIATRFCLFLQVNSIIFAYKKYICFLSYGEEKEKEWVGVTKLDNSLARKWFCPRFRSRGWYTWRVAAGGFAWFIDNSAQRVYFQLVWKTLLAHTYLYMYSYLITFHHTKREVEMRRRVESGRLEKEKDGAFEENARFINCN